VTDYAVRLGGDYCNLGNLIGGGSQPAESLTWYGKAVAALRPVLAREPRLATARLFLRNAHWGRAMVLQRLQRFAEAAADWQQALTCNDDPKATAEF
jgi:hypothetical protein